MQFQHITYMINIFNSISNVFVLTYACVVHRNIQKLCGYHFSINFVTNNKTVWHFMPGYCIRCPGAQFTMIFHHSSNWIISSFSHPSFKEAITMKFCTWHDSCGVVMDHVGIEPRVIRSRVQRLNHWAIKVPEQPLAGPLHCHGMCKIL